MISNLPIFHGCMGENAAWEISKDEIVFSALLFLIFGKKTLEIAASWRWWCVEKPSQQIFNHSEFWHIQRWGKKRTKLAYYREQKEKLLSSKDMKSLQGVLSSSHKKWITLQFHSSSCHVYNEQKDWTSLNLLYMRHHFNFFCLLSYLVRK